MHEGARYDSAGLREDERGAAITCININTCTVGDTRIASRRSAQSTIERKYFTTKTFDAKKRPEHTHTQALEVEMQGLRLVARFTHTLFVDEPGTGVQDLGFRVQGLGA